MAEFDAFGDPSGGFVEEDPVADFMARQKEELAGLEDDLAFGETEQKFQPQENFVQNNQWGNDFAEPNENDYSGFEGELDMGGLNIDPPKASSSDPYSSIRVQDKQRQEPEKIRLWRIEQQERLQKKDEDAEKQKAEWRQIAKKELQDWYKHHDEQLEKKKRTNREAEQDFIAQRDETIPGHEWEKIGRLCDFNPKSVRNQKDVSRMRSILLQLKQTPLVKA